MNPLLFPKAFGGSVLKLQLKLADCVSYTSMLFFLEAKEEDRGPEFGSNLWDAL